MTLPPARWYFDANITGVGKILSRARDDVTWPGDSGERQGPSRRWLPPSPVDSSDVADEIWIPTVTNAGMTIVTRDRHIRTRLREIQAVRQSGARIFAVSQSGQLNRWDLLEVIVSRWRDMEETVRSTRGPWIFTVTRATKPSQIFPAKD